MKKLLPIILIIFLISPIKSQSQYFYIYGDKTFGGTSDEGSGKIISTHNYQFFISGESYSGIDGDKTDSLCNASLPLEQDLWILKIDSAFNILWQRDIGGNHYDYNSHIQLMNDSSRILFSCLSRSDSSCSKSENNRSFPLIDDDYWIGMLDSNGAMLWDRTLGGSSSEEGSKIVELSTGEFLVCGASLSPADGDKSGNNYGLGDFWIIKLNTLGNKIWDNVYGGIEWEHASQGRIDVIPLNNGDFLFGGITQSPLSGTITDTSRGLYDIWIAKVDSAGNQIWDKRYGGNKGDYLWQIKTTSDDGFIICGATRSDASGEVSDTSRGNSDYWVVKIDSIGNKMWDKRFGGAQSEEAIGIEQDFDGGYLVAGRVRSGAGLDVTEPAYGISDYWVIKIDSVGNKIWDKRFGGPGINYLTSFILLPDSSIMLFGTSDSGVTSIKTDPGEGSHDYWLIHFRYSDSPFALNESLNSNFVSIYPNPTTGLVTVTAKENLGLMKFYLYDVTGRIIFSENVSRTTTLDISEYAPSLYFYEVITDKGEKSFGKILKQY